MVFWIWRHIDPYMVLSVDDDVKDKTKVVKKSKNPAWNRVAYIPITDFDYNYGEFIFKVLDYTVAHPWGEDIMGLSTIQVCKVVEECKVRPVEDWYHMDRNSGEIHIKLSFIPLSKETEEIE